MSWVFAFFFFFKKTIAIAEHEHLSSQAKWEAEMGRSTVPGQPGEKSLSDPHLNRKKAGVVVHACHCSDGGKFEMGGS
jgi:hypothetical protein